MCFHNITMHGLIAFEDTRQAITDHSRTVLHHSPYIPNLTYSNLPLFGSMKKRHRKQEFCKEDGMKEAFHTCKNAAKNLLWDRYTCLCSKVDYCIWEEKRSCWKLDLESWEISLHFVMIFVHSIKSVIN